MRLSSLTTALTLFAFAACSIDDRKLTEHGGEAGDDQGGGTGGSSGSDTGGTAGKGGSTTTGGTAGKGGTSATGGTAGKGGTSGTGGSGGFGATEDCDGDPLDIDEDLVRSCLLQIGCNPFIPGTSLSFCITNQRLRTFSQDDCGTGATNCDDYLACRGQGYYAPQDCTSGAAVYCEGSLGVTCARYPYAIDCEKFGGECATYTDDAGSERVWCNFPALDSVCLNDPGGTEQCGTVTGSTDIAYTCIGGQAFGNDCELLGSECRDGSCYYVLPTCSTPGVTCGTGTRLDVCYDTNDVARYGCAQGLGCEASATSAACVAPGCTPDDACAESCNGTELTFCYGSIPVTLDCADYGFRQCLESTPSAGEDPLAYCAFPETALDRACEVEDTDTTCGACAKMECCSAWTACLDSPDCVGYFNCASDCAGVSTCIDDCADTYPRGLAPYNAFFDCRDVACGC